MIHGMMQIKGGESYGKTKEQEISINNNDNSSTVSYDWKCLCITEYKL